MRKRTGVLAIVATLAVSFATSSVRAGGAPCPSCAHAGVAHALGHGETPPVWEDESPLYPQLAWWTFQRSQCKQPHPCKGGSWLGHSAPTEVPSFPPLPYSPLAGKMHAPAPPAGPAAAAPAPNAAAAPSAETTPAQNHPAALPEGPASPPRQASPPPTDAPNVAPTPPPFSPFN